MLHCWLVFFSIIQLQYKDKSHTGELLPHHWTQQPSYSDTLWQPALQRHHSFQAETLCPSHSHLMYCGWESQVASTTNNTKKKMICIIYHS